MKTLNKKSWHYRLANEYGDYRPGFSDPVTNICDYSREVLNGLWNVLLIIAITTFVLVSIEIAIIWAFVSFRAGIWIQPSEGAQLGLVLVTFAVLGVIGIAFMNFKENRRYAQKLTTPKKKQKEPGFIRTWYTAFKTKTCVPIKLV